MPTATPHHPAARRPLPIPQADTNSSFVNYYPPCRPLRHGFLAGTFEQCRYLGTGRYCRAQNQETALLSSFFPWHHRQPPHPLLLLPALLYTVLSEREGPKLREFFPHGPGISRNPGPTLARSCSHPVLVVPAPPPAPLPSAGIGPNERTNAELRPITGNT